MNYHRVLEAWAPAAFPVVLLTFALIARPEILDTANLLAVLIQTVPILLIALSASLLLISGAIDLSAGLIVAFASVVMGYFLSSGYGVGIALPMACGAALLAGVANGLLVTWLRVPAFIATLATSIILQGINLILSKGIFIVRDPVLKFVGRETIAGIPITILLATTVAFVAFVVLKYTRFGLKTYALGSSPVSARLAGVSIALHQFTLFLIASFICFLTAVVLVSRTLIVTPNVGGMPLLLDGIAAAVIGGTSIFGGKGRVRGIILGAITMALVTHLLRVFGVNPTSIDVFKGLLIITALLVDAGLRYHNNRSKAAAVH